MINTWQPAITTPSEIDQELLSYFAQLGLQVIQGDVRLNSHVNKDQQSLAQGWIRLPETDWQSAIEQQPLDNLYPLAAFFTLAEMQLTGWQCGSKNPAIWIFRWLKRHQQQPEKAQVQALKKLTDNRFIPYGSAL